MKTLNITLVTKANSYKEAEMYGMNDMMELAKIIGVRSGSTVASCNGDVKHMNSNEYEVSAKMQIDGTINVDQLIKEMQEHWSHRPRILTSCIFVSEEQKPEPVQKPRDYEPVACDSCGQIMVKGYENVINPGTEVERHLCERCFTDAYKEKAVTTCWCCENVIGREDMVQNPVTGENDLCPICGCKA